MEQRYMPIKEIETRSDDNDDLYIEGYFVVFDDVYKVCPGATESIARGAFADSIGGDVRALYNHNHDLVLGRSGAGTLTLKEDEHGLYGRIKVNRNDTDAMNAYQRIQRGDISGASFGFEIADEVSEIRENGDVHWTIRKVDPLYEISPCVFPAYQGTAIGTRAKDLEAIRQRQADSKKALIDSWATNLRTKLKGETTDGTGSITSEKED